MLKQQLEQDLKKALLAGDKEQAMTLRSLKSVILYAEVAKGVREEGLGDDEITTLFAKEAKKRQESADLYRQGGDETRAAAELAEKAIIEAYLPEQLSDEELFLIIDAVITELGATDPQAMGQIMGKVKQKTAGRADGSRIARAVKQRLDR
jgi:uncharacterized protein YqeY